MSKPSRFDPFELLGNRIAERRRKIAEEIARNRRGEYTVPTWVLAVALVAMIAGIAALCLLAR